MYELTEEKATFRYRFGYVDDRPNYIPIELEADHWVEITQGGPHEEGWSVKSNRISYDDGELRLLVDYTAQDCDGRISSSREFVATQLQNGGVPLWKEESSSQRDYTAESMNY